MRSFRIYEICNLGGLDVHYNIFKTTFPDLCDAEVIRYRDTMFTKLVKTLF